MEPKDFEKYIVGKWYKDRDKDFVKFKEFEGDYLKFTAYVRYEEYNSAEGAWTVSSFPKCIPMSINEMKRFLPESEWWDKKQTQNKQSELFPIY